MEDIFHSNVNKCFADKTDRIRNSVILQERPTSSGAAPKKAKLITNLSCTLGDKLEAAKPAAWKGLGELPQVAWATELSGLYLVVDLWAGFSGTIMALLSLGIRAIVLAAEYDDDARYVAAKNMPNIVHIEKVEHIEPEVFRKVLQRRTFAGIIIGGGSPCQGNSVLNANRRGLDDERSRQPLLLNKLADDIEALTEVKEQNIPVMR